MRTEKRRKRIVRLSRWISNYIPSYLAETLPACLGSSYRSACVCVCACRVACFLCSGRLCTGTLAPPCAPPYASGLMQQWDWLLHSTDISIQPPASGTDAHQSSPPENTNNISTPQSSIGLSSNPSTKNDLHRFWMHDLRQICLSRYGKLWGLWSIFGIF